VWGRYHPSLLAYFFSQSFQSVSTLSGTSDLDVSALGCSDLKLLPWRATPYVSVQFIKEALQ
jgi:hypothetical protein